MAVARSSRRSQGRRRSSVVGAGGRGSIGTTAVGGGGGRTSTTKAIAEGQQPSQHHVKRLHLGIDDSLSSEDGWDFLGRTEHQSVAVTAGAQDWAMFSDDDEYITGVAFVEDGRLKITRHAD